MPLQGIILVSPKAGFRKPLLPVAKLAKEIGGAKAAKELGIPEGTIHTWLKAVRAFKVTSILVMIILFDQASFYSM